PFVEIVSTHYTRNYAEFSPHAFGEIERRAALHLRQRDFETRGRFCADQGSGGRGKGRVRASACGLERREDILYLIAPEQRLDYRVAGCHRPAPGLLPVRRKRCV